MCAVVIGAALSLRVRVLSSYAGGGASSAALYGRSHVDRRGEPSGLRL
jgi:hypothetical protein